MSEKSSSHPDADADGGRLESSIEDPAVNPDAAEFQDGKRLAGSSSVSANDALVGGAAGPMFGDDTDSLNFPDNSPETSAADNPDLDLSASGRPEEDDEEADADFDPTVPFADVGGAGGGPGAGSGPA